MEAQACANVPKFDASDMEDRNVDRFLEEVCEDLERHRQEVRHNIEDCGMVGPRMDLQHAEFYEFIEIVHQEDSQNSDDSGLANQCVDMDKESGKNPVEGNAQNEEKKQDSNKDPACSSHRKDSNEVPATSSRGICKECKLKSEADFDEMLGGLHLDPVLKAVQIFIPTTLRKQLISLMRESGAGDSFKVTFFLNAKFIHAHDDLTETQEFKTLVYVLNASHDVDRFFDEVKDVFYNKISEYETRSGEWVFKKIINIDMTVSRFDFHI